MIENGIEHYRVTVAFRNSKGRAQQVFWIVKVQADPLAENRINHEVKVYTELLTEIGKFLANKRNPRARYLLNIPDLIFHDRQWQGGKVIRCHLVTEDVTETKRCNPLRIGRIIGGLNLGQFKVLLGTLAQFHAVGIAWSHALKDDSLLDSFPFLYCQNDSVSGQARQRQVHLDNYQRLLEHHYPQPDARPRRLFELLRGQAEDLLQDNLKEDMCDVLGSVCLGPVMSHEVMFQYESQFFDLCGVGGADNIIWNSVKYEEDDENSNLTPICAAVTNCQKVHFGHLLKELSVYFFTLPEALIRERYIVFLLQSYCHVLTMTLEMLDVNWGRHFGDLTFTKMIVAFYSYIPQALLRAVIAHMELTDPDHLEAHLASKETNFVIDPSSSVKDKSSHPTSPPSGSSSSASTPLKYIPLTKERIKFLLSLTNRVHKPV